jgi:DNA-binding NtrC family response regulator
MKTVNTLKGKKILIVDDERDVLDQLKEILDDCIVDTAPGFVDAKAHLIQKRYDAVILDIMGVNGYELLGIAHRLKIPVIMLTAHALSAEHFRRSIANGAFAYIPKEKIAYIDVYLKDLIETFEKSGQKSGDWFSLLKTYFENKFGSDWFRADEELRKNFENEFQFSKEHLGNIFS